MRSRMGFPIVSRCYVNLIQPPAHLPRAQVGHGAGGLADNPPPPGEVTFRSPSASIGLLVMMQLQFLALLSLVPSVHESSSFLASFVENLR